MHNVNDPALRRPDDPEIVSAAAALQSQLLYFRLANYNNIAIPAIDDAIKSLAPRQRELYLALAAPCINDEDSRRFVLNYLRDENLHTDNPLSVSEHAVLAALFEQAHMPQNRGQLLITNLTATVNRYLQIEGERRRLNARHVGALLTGFGFTRRRRMNSGWALLLEREDLRRIHQVAEHYGANHRPGEQSSFVACSFCPDVPPVARPFATGVVMG
jgi:hypothetical protein